MSCKNKFKVNESWYIALFVVNRSIKKLYSIDYANIYLFQIFSSIDFSIDCVNIYPFRINFAMENLWVTPYFLYWDSSNLKLKDTNYFI